MRVDAVPAVFRRAVGRALTVLAAAALSALAVTGSAQAQAAWPERPLRLVVGFPPGGVTDVLARVLAERMASGLGRPVVVENRPGAAGNIAAEQVARAAPDGYSLLLGTNASHATNPFLYRNVSFDPIRDFTPIGMVATITNVLVVHPSVPARNVEELVALAKASPGKLNFASAAPGSAGHLIGELFKVRTGTDMVHVPYKGAAPAMTDMLAGRVELMFATLQTVLAPVQAGKLRALAVTGPERVVALGDVPTLSEALLPGFSADAWFAVFGPKGLPEPVVARLNSEIAAALADPAVRSRIEAQGFRIRTSTPAALEQFVGEEMRKWGEAVRLSGARAE